MSCTNSIRHRIIIRLTATGAALTAGAFVELRLLNAYSVPLLLAFPCALAVGTGIGRLVEAVADWFATTAYRCRATGCTYKVRVRHADAIELRRWQEAAASHPGHGLNPRN
ncbi:hypothetical protein [Streptomyces sp. NPDC051993]|uniref:hypothetical protein n=1 Tax=Streptomyces sp. NPDC051993 TaxID=3155286 RepID=UPI003440E74B